MTWLHTQCKLQTKGNWKQSSDYNCSYSFRWQDISKVIQNWSEIKIHNGKKLHNKVDIRLTHWFLVNLGNMLLNLYKNSSKVGKNDISCK